jgi:molybdopterin converting factor small subunit
LGSDEEELGMSRVQVEVMPWLSRYFAAEGYGRVILEREVSDGATVRELLEEITTQNQEFKDVLFNTKTGKLAGHVGLILNGRFLELAGGMETQLKPGDTLRLMPGFTGG